MVRRTTTLRQALHEGSLTFARYSPGRFFAQNELKAMMAYMLMHYDIKPEHEGVRPKDAYQGFSVIPDAKARVLFRKRRLD